jgi:beta-lactamase class A
MSTNHLLIAFLCLLLISAANIELKAQEAKTDKKLQESLQDAVKDFNGIAGVYVYHLRTEKEAGVNADSLFPTASIVKIPILVGVFDKIHQGELSYHQPLVYHDSIKYGGSGLMQFFKDSTVTDLSFLAALMITYSDNTASLWNQALAGGGSRINEIMDSYGFRVTRVNSRTSGREKSWEKYGWGQTSPREMATLLLKIRQHEIVSKAASEEMYRLMTNVYYDDYALSQIPPYIQTASKQGMVDASRSELVMVNAPHGDYVFYIATKNNVDKRWEDDNESWMLARKISALLWNYFEPRSKWTPATGSNKFHEGLAY